MTNTVTIKLLIIFTAFVSLVAIVGMPILYLKLRQTDAVKALKEKEAIAKGDPAAIEKKLSDIIYVPQGETPVVRAATSPEFQGLAFFAQAQKGDVAILYQKAGKIYLFDPVAQKIREVGALALPPSPAPSPLPSPTPEITNMPPASPSSTVIPTKNRDTP